MKQIILLLLLLVSIQAKYLDTQSCKECHEKIHSEHVDSMHHKSTLFTDQLHKKIKEISTPDKYSCALCHMPAATNLRAIITGEEQPNKNSKKQTDGVSCFYCHQITKVMELKHKNINFYNYKGEQKPTFFGNLNNADTSDKHNSEDNKIYKNSQVCMGCHGKKYNKNNVQICNGYNQLDETSDCIGCHMQKDIGGVTKLNKRGRDKYSTHKFLGIRSDEMVKKAVDLKLDLLNENKHLQLTIENKMGHDIIMQPLRLKYVKTTIKRFGRVIWSNFDKDPTQDKEATFMILFKDKNDRQTFPPFATGFRFKNNLKANSTKVVTYDIPELQKGDKITSTWTSFIVRPSLVSALKLDEKEYGKKYVGKSISIEIK